MDSLNFQDQLFDFYESNTVGLFDDGVNEEMKLGDSNGNMVMN